MDTVRADRRGQEGMALLVATLFIAVAVLVLAALSLRVVNQSNQVSQYTDYKDCMAGLESALAQSISDLEAVGDGHIGIGSWTPPPPGEFFLPDFDDPDVEPLSPQGLPRVRYMAYAQNWADDGLDNNGDGFVDDDDENFTYTIHALAQSGAVRRRVESVIRGFDVNVWRNAIFAGTGQSGGLINGNVSIHGSVHLLGTDLPEGAEALTAIDLSGTSLIHNNYVGIPADLAVRVPPLPQRLFNGEVVSTLNAELRVRNGLVGLSGNSEIGEPDVPGNTSKETLDGTYVSDGWTGNSTIDDGGRGIPTRVSSDNGWNETYDLGDRVPLPLLDHDYRELGTGRTYINPMTGRNYTHREYFRDVLAGTPHPGNVTIRANSHFYYNATRPLDTNPANRLPTDQYIYFNADTNVMEINGPVQFNGDLTLTRGNGNDRTIHYTGRGCWLVLGNVTLDTDLLAMNPNGTTVNTFPVNNILGIMAEGSMTVGSQSQLRMMGAFYAQQQIRSSKQTITLGTFVSNYFDMGKNVPDIFQVPELADNLPLGMIGAYPILVFQQVSWREL